MTVAPLPDLGAVRGLQATAGLAPIETEFIGRVFSTPAGRYVQTLTGVGLHGLDCVVDVGAGYGQWSLCLAALNRRVIAIEPQEGRVAFLRELLAATGVPGVSVQHGSAESIPLPPETADGALCFGVLQYADTARLFAELARVLRPGGLAYVVGKGLGGYLCDWIERPNRSDAFDPRQVAADAFANTLHLEQRGALHPASRWTDRIVPLERAAACAAECGLEVLDSGPEGAIVERSGAALAHPSHFFRRTYRGFPFSYELLLQRPPSRARGS